MSAGAEIRGMADKLRGAPDRLAPLVQAATTKAVLDTQSMARRLAPVDTGYLKASITVAILPGPAGAVVGEVTAGANYAAYLENGTSRQPPQPFMRPALEAVRPGWEKALTQLGGEVIR